MWSQGNERAKNFLLSMGYIDLELKVYDSSTTMLKPIDFSLTNEV